jgi:hypothetical protein
MLRNDDNAYQRRVAIIYFSSLLVCTSESASITLYMHSMSSDSLGRSDPFGIEACMRVLSTGISKDDGRGMRYNCIWLLS